MKSEFRATLERIKQLSRDLLPPVSATASYSNQQVLHMLGFRLLAHAELEGHLESCAQNLVDHYSSRLSSRLLSRRMRRILLTQAKMSQSYPPTSLAFAVTYNKVENNAINSLLANHSGVISVNNGVSEKDVLKLFIPLGCEPGYFSHWWLESLNAMARARGEVAHNSALTPSVNAQPTPQGERRLLALPFHGTRLLIDELQRLKDLA